MKFVFAFMLAPTMAFADPRIDVALDTHILPRFAALTDATAALAAAESCEVEEEWNTAATAWIGVSHLRFGPTEIDNRAFALAFWPDPRGATPKSLAALLTDDAPAISDASVAGRGLYAMEFLLFDPAFANIEGRCDLIADIANDAHLTALAIQSDWEDRYDAVLRSTGNEIYRNDTEALQELYKALTTGLDFTSDMRLGRPLGTFDRPRPARAEMRRSGRSLDNVRVSLTSLEELALILAGEELMPDVEARFEKAIDQAGSVASVVGSADLSIVENVADRIKVEALQQRVVELRAFLSQDLGPELGVIEGFNSLDGD
ncbi:imelysin family protein [Octadecabacter ascidiaceicola]|uniref:Imelysin n=1 Tax=Octadecabacter ascidiaceicola TaxID=1655543 RepID=A0A238JJP6_9RHOB|nr:imelysin family protein [Octadecabacter ascidiaceicola]SMX30879.1 Imelysin [Octadecabacter ascidiaceicola]